MFEQAVLKTQKRPWTWMASFTMQSAFVACAVLLSIWQVEQLPRFQVPDPPVPLPRHPRAVEVVAAERAFGASSGAPSPFSSRPFTAPSRIPAAVAMIFDPVPTAAPSGIPQGVNYGRYAHSFEVPAVPAPPPAAPKAVDRPAPPPKLVRLSSGVLASKLIKRVIPVYPKLALALRLSGRVKLLAVIGLDGRVRDLQLIEGHPILAPAAMEAVRQWLYTPTLLNGEPVEVNAPIEVNFNLR